MVDYTTGAVRDTGGKGRMDLLPMCALIRISRHMEDAILPDPETGTPHYPERNWEKGLPMHSMIDSAFRHLAKYVDGQTDEDHLCAAATNLLMAMWMEEKHPEMQDIPTRSGARTVSTVTKKEKKKLKLCERYDRKNRRCNGTKEQDPYNCCGDRSICDFYEHVREKALDECNRLGGEQDGNI